MSWCFGFAAAGWVCVFKCLRVWGWLACGLVYGLCLVWFVAVRIAVGCSAGLRICTLV